MATYAAYRLLEMTDNAAAIVAIELLAAAQGIELRRPLQTSAPLQRFVAKVRQHSAFLAEDRPLHRDIATLAQAVLEGNFGDEAGANGAASGATRPPGAGGTA
jgi:histidine ammonia-lyase